jgi:3-oxoacyl-[acyl-carrier-protein] synthase II
MMHEGFVAPNRNLDRVDPRCASLNYVLKEPRAISKIDITMNNNFAFGGINTSLLFRKV